MSNNEEKKDPESPTKVEESKANEENPEIKVAEQHIIEEINEPKEEVKIEEPIPEETKQKKKKKNVIIEEAKTDLKKVKHNAPLKITNEKLLNRLEYSKLISPLRFMTKTQIKKEKIRRKRKGRKKKD